MKKNLPEKGGVKASRENSNRLASGRVPTPLFRIYNRPEGRQLPLLLPSTPLDFCLLRCTYPCRVYHEAPHFVHVRTTSPISKSVRLFTKPFVDRSPMTQVVLVGITWSVL